MLLKIIPVEISVQTNKLKSFALLDGGSTVTLIDKQLVRDLNIHGQQLNLKVKGICDREMVSARCEKVEFCIEGELGKFHIKNALAVANLNLPAQSLSREIVRYIAKTESVFVQPYINAQAKILIGQDNWPLLATQEIRQIKDQFLGISLSPLGWVVHGVTRGETHELANTRAITNETVDNNNIFTLYEENEKLDKLVKDYFQLDSFGVNETCRKTSSLDRAMQILQSTSRCVGNAWETGLLWKRDCPSLVDSRATALKRLFSLENKLDKDSEYATLYYTEMKRFIENGYAKKIEENISQPRVWYLPHFGVRNANKPEKVRLVFDASDKSAGISLNDQLDSGPDFLNSIAGVLIRFRQHAVAVKGDIKDMYLRVHVREEDRGAQRFFWRGKDRKNSPDIYEMSCLIFGATSSPCSALYVKNENAKTFVEQKPDAAKSIEKNSYMDDYLVSRPTNEEAATLVSNVIEINATANFEMHGWASNDARVLIGVPENARLNNANNMQLCDRGGERVLGVFWDMNTDFLKFNIGYDKISKELISGTRKPTKREYLRVIMSVFDPLGLLTPFTLKSKILMQEIWRSGIGWDEKLRDEEHKGWLSWINDLRDVKSYSVPHCLTPKHESPLGAQLHVFCDASLKAYSAAVYIRFDLQRAPAHVALVMAKSRVC